MTGKLFILSGPSGVGKTTIVKALYERLPWLHSAVTFTTRKKRRTAREDKEIQYVTEDRFRQLRDEGRFLEWAEVHGNLYGTDRTSVVSRLEQGEPILLNIDVQGARSIREQFPEACTIFILPEDVWQLEGRIRDRTDITEAEITRRLDNIAREMDEATNYEHRINNREGKVEDAIQEVVDIVEREAKLA